MKNRFTSVDCAAEVACINHKLLGMRLANVYDLSAKVPNPPMGWMARRSIHLPMPACMQTYVLKMARSGEDGEKIFLLLESGSRFHTTEVGGWADGVVMAKAHT